MAHFALVVDGIVENVIVAEQDFIDILEDSENWIQTSYNTRGGVHYNPETGEPSADQSKALRKNYAGIGFTYDSNLDAFISPSPFPSWIFNQNTCWWDPPIPHPDDGIHYYWDEQNQTWI